MADEYNIANDAALPNAAVWVMHLLTGSIASVMATLAIAFVGLAMLGGRLDVRSGLRVMLGCFVLFNAAQIASGIVSFANGRGQPTFVDWRLIAPPALPSTAPQFDPYAGAATPQ